MVSRTARLKVTLTSALNDASIPSPQKSKPEVFATTLKIVTNFHQIWQVATAIQCRTVCVKLFTTPDVCTHTLPGNATIESKCDKIV